jgi:hypothetical protein
MQLAPLQHGASFERTAGELLRRGRWGGHRRHRRRVRGLVLAPTAPPHLRHPGGAVHVESTCPIARKQRLVSTREEPVKCVCVCEITKLASR